MKRYIHSLLLCIVLLKPLQTIRATQELISWNTRTLPLHNFGKISEKKIFKIVIPSNNKLLIGFIPTLGSACIRNKHIQLLLVVFENPNRANTSITRDNKEPKNEFFESETMVKIYRQLPTQSQWTQIGIIANITAPLKPLTLEINPNGDLSVYSMYNQTSFAHTLSIENNQ